MIALAAVPLSSPAPGVAAPTAESIKRASAFFTSACGDADKLPIVLAGLRSTGDDGLVPFFAALTRSGDKELRLIATASIESVDGKKAVSVLRERLNRDPSMVVRSEALLALMKRNAADSELLTRALKIDDDGVRILAARGLASSGNIAAALPALRALAESKDLDTAIFARMTLLAAGDRKQIAHLRKAVLDEDTSDRLLIRMLNQIREEKITAATPVADYLAKPDQSLSVQVRAYMAKAALSPGAGREIVSAIQTSDNVLLKCNLLRILSELKGAEEYFAILSKQQDVTGSIARFEIASRSGGKKAAKALAEMLKPGHPIVIDYAIFKMQKDIATGDREMDFYVGPMMQYVRSADIDSRRMTPTNGRVAKVIRLLGRTGGTTSTWALRELLRKKSNTTLRELAVGALFRCDTPNVCPLVKPLTRSPFPKIMQYATLILARHGDRDAVEPLMKLQADSYEDDVELLTLVNWYLLSFAGRAEGVMKAVAENITEG